MSEARRKKEFVFRAGKGAVMVSGVPTPRLLNVDLSKDIVGHIEVNRQATSTMGRLKTYKAYVYCDPNETVIAEGDVIQDRADSKYYLTFSAAPQHFGFEIVYYDCQLYLADAVMDVQRFGQSEVRDNFGRVVSDAPTAVTGAADVRCMVIPINYDTVQQEDRLIAQDKLKVVMQSSVDVKVADRLVSATGDKYIVVSVDKASSPVLQYISVDTDVR